MEKKGLRPFRFIKSPAGEGRSYAEGAQRDSNAIPLRVPASGGVWLIWFTAVSAHFYRLVARQSVKRSSGA